MTIERLHFEEGYPLEDSETLLFEKIKKIFKDNKAKSQILPEGDYKLTSKGCPDDFLNHDLKVLTNGNAIYKATPLNEDVGTIDVGSGQFKRGGTIVYLPKDADMAVVSGLLKDKTIGIFDIIRYTPGPSPK